MRPSPLLACFCACLVLGLVACSDDGTAPVIGPADDVLARSTVGPAGGELVHGDIRVTVPPGAFSAVRTLEIRRDGTAAEPATGTFHLAGVPADFAAPLGFSLAVTAAQAPPVPTPALVFAVAGVTVRGDTLGSPLAVDAVHGDGSLAGELAPGRYLLASDPLTVLPVHATLGIRVCGSLSHESTRIDEPLPIAVTGDAVLDAERVLIGGWLQQGAAVFGPVTGDFQQILAPDLDGHAGLVDAFVRQVNGPSSAAGAPAPPAPPAGPAPAAARLGIDLALDAGEPMTGATRGLALGALWSAAYTARTGHARDWWQVATGEHLLDGLGVPGAPRSGPATALAGYRRLVDPVAPTAEQVRDHGLAMASLAAWIDAREGEGWGREALAASLAARAAGTDDGPAFLADTLPQPAATWWPEFAAALVAGDIPGFPASAVLETVDQTWPLRNSLVDTAHVFGQDHFTLDGAVYRVGLDRVDFDPAAELRFTLAEDAAAELAVFTVDGEDVDLLARGPAVTVADLRLLAADGVDLLLLVTCSETSLAAPGRTLAVSASLQEPDIRAQVFATTHTRLELSDFEYTTASTDPLCLGGRFVDDGIIMDNFILGDTRVLGTWDGTMFTGSAEVMRYPGMYWQRRHRFLVQVAVSEDARRIIWMDYRRVDRYYNGSNPDDYEYHQVTYTGPGLPLIVTDDNAIAYVTGPEVLAGLEYARSHWTDGSECVYETTRFALRKFTTLNFSLLGD